MNGTQLEAGTNEATQTGVSQGKRSNRKTWDHPVRTEVSLNEDYKHGS